MPRRGLYDPLLRDLDPGTAYDGVTVVNPFLYNSIHFEFDYHSLPLHHPQRRRRRFAHCAAAIARRCGQRWNRGFGGRAHQRNSSIAAKRTSADSSPNRSIKAEIIGSAVPPTAARACTT